MSLFRPFVLACALLAAALPAAQAEPLKQRFAELHAAARQEGQVVFYNAYRKETNQALVEFWRREFPNVALKIVQKQSLDLIPTIEAERAAGRTLGDLVLINERFIADDWARRGYLEPYKVRDFERIDARYKDPDGNYYIPAVYLLTAAYNTQAFPDKSVLPKNLKAFTDAQWKDKLLFGDPAVAASNQTFFLALLKNEAVTWDTLAALARQNLLFTRGNADSARLIATGERVLSPMVSSQNVVSAREKGQPIDFYVLEEGAILVEQEVGLLKGGPNPNAARLLLEVLTSAEGQALVAEAGAYWPTHPDAEAPGHLPKLASLHPISTDVRIGGPESKEFLTRFAEVFQRN
ncbi:ABC transporter substrate-binding protein [Azotobacter sp. CWF10]